MASVEGAPRGAWIGGDRSSEEPPPRARGAGLPLGIVLGIPLVADWSLLVIFALVAMQLGAGLLPSWHPQWAPGLVWTIAIAAALLFFVSIAVHELSHALVARAFGIRVSRITLFLFGGMAQMEREPSSPKSELLVAAIGPLVSLVIGVGATVLGTMLAGDATELMAEDPELAYASLDPVATLLLWLGPVNVMLALFNMVPGFPLDGGRVLRALLWWGTGDLRRATAWAAGAGRFFGLTLIALGVWSMLRGSVGSGLWLALIGWFLAGAARSGYEQVAVRELLAGVPVTQVMRTRFEAVTPRTTIAELVFERFMSSDQSAFPVLDGERLAGIVAMHDVRKVRRDAWSETRVGEVMTGARELVTVSERATAVEALEALARSEVDQVLVVDGEGALAGMVRRADVVKFVAVHSVR